MEDYFVEHILQYMSNDDDLRELAPAINHFADYVTTQWFENANILQSIWNVYDRADIKTGILNLFRRMIDSLKSRKGFISPGICICCTKPLKKVEKVNKPTKTDEICSIATTEIQWFQKKLIKCVKQSKKYCLETWLKQLKNI